MFQNQKFVTQGASCEVGLLLQLFLWQLIDELPIEKDYLQVFQLTLEGNKKKSYIVRKYRTINGSIC